MVITNHLNPLWSEGDAGERAEEYLSDYKAAKEAAGDDLNVILGIEIRFPENNNDYLVYGVCEDDLKHFISLIPYGIKNFYKEVKTDKNIILQAHPFRKHIELAPLDCIDGIESINMHPNHHAKPSIAFKYAKENNLIVSGGSDFHHPNQVGVCLMRTKTPITSAEELVSAITSGDYVLDVCGSVILP